MNVLKKLTKEYLKMNKKRTLVTIIGVILTGAMISGVTTLGASFQNFLVETQKQDSGNWEVRCDNISYKNVQYIENNDDFKNTFLTQTICQGPDYSDSTSETEIRLMGYEDNAIKNMNIQLKEGKYPTNENEILVPTSYMDANENLKIGDSINIATKVENIVNAPETDSEEKTSEITTHKVLETKLYKIVGISDNHRLYGGSYYKIITHLDRSTLTEDSIINISMTSTKISKIYEQVDEIVNNLNLYTNNDEKENNIAYNTSLLMYKGVNDESGFNTMLISVCAILIVVIGIGSIIVIYNSFAISVSERKKQFGMLASIGATKKQIKKMVLYEGTIVGIIGIPLGIIAGIIGIGITLKIVDSLISPMFANSGMATHFEMVVSYGCLIIAAILIAITIFLSVFIPARQASKISPIEAIRGANDVKIKPRKVRTPKFLRKLYGIEGDIALKNLKRSKKRYRTTVISLTISIVLFLTFNGFVSYMFQGFDAMYTTVPYDYEISVYSKGGDTDNIIAELLSMDNTTKIVAQKTLDATTELNNDNINDRLKEIIPDNSALKTSYEYNDGKGAVRTYIVSLDNNAYNEYLKQVGITKLNDNQCILSNYVNGVYMYRAEFEIFNYKENDKINTKVTSMSTGEEIAKEIEIAKVTNLTPYGIPDMVGYSIIVVNESTFNQISALANADSDKFNNAEILIESDKTSELPEKIETIMRKYPSSYYNGADVKEQMSLLRNLKLIIEIFLYGFIVLISLIGISNIFNTITTNVNLRRREFANLKSIGMTDKAFNKMMNLECLFYGTKALLWGLPIGCLMCYFLSKAFESEMMLIFRIPWPSIAIVVVAVYLIVFMTMRYARSKIKKENIIEVLRDDNI